MSKLFSISMATVLMLMSLMGPMQPSNVMVDEPQEMTPMSGEVPLDDTSDGEDAVVEERGDAELPPVEGDEISAEDEALTPVEEPAENANAPPAGDDPVVEEEPAVAPEPETTVEDESVVEDEPVFEEETIEVQTTSDVQAEEAPEVETGNLISPSAVDPNPGDCNVDEICDGGGGGDETPETVTVAITITESSRLSDGATVVVKTSGDAPVGSRVTGANGVVEFELSVGESYLVDVTRVGYQSRTGVSLSVSSDTSSLSINLQPVFGRVTVTVTDSVTGDPVRYAIVRFTGKSGTYFNTDKNSGSTGQISTSMDSGEYVAFFSHPDYVSQQFDVTITVGDSISVQLVPKAVEPVPNVLSLEVVDEVTGDPIPNASVTLRLPTSPYTTVSEGTTDSNGRWDSASLENIEYDLVISDPFYRLHLERISSIPTSVRTIELDPGPELTATYTVLDIETDEPIQDAFITAKDYSSDTQFAAGQTDATGNWTFNPILGRGYWVTIEKDGYQTSTTYAYVSGDYSKTVQLMPPGYPGSIQFNVGDSNVNLRIHGATITMSNGKVTETVVTDELGKASLISVPSGTYDLTIEANGYETYLGTAVISPNIELHGTYSLVPLPAATLDVQLQAPVGNNALLMTNVGIASTTGMSGPVVNQVSGAMQPVAGQTIQLVNPDTGLVTVEGVTDADGFVTLPVARQGTYQLNVSVEGYQPYSAPYELTQDAEHIILLQPIVTDNPGDPDPGTTDPDEGTTPGTGDPDEGTTPGTGDPDEGTTPGAETPVDDVTPGAGGSELVGSADPDIDNDVSDSTGDVGTEAVARSAGASSDAATGSVNQLPNTGAGESQSHVGIAALTLVAAFTLLGALGVRRRV